MRQRILNWIIGRQETYFGAPLDYLREIAHISTTAFLKLALLTPLARHRRRLPRTAYHLATLVATQEEDCGTCVQIAVNLAKREGAPSHYIRAALEGNFSDLPRALAESCQYARNIARGYDSPELASRLLAHYGPEGLMELALAISTARVYPTLKRAMGFSNPCAPSPIRAGIHESQPVPV